MYSSTPEIANCIQTGVGSFQTYKINHNAIREDGPFLIDEHVTKETIRTEVDWNENYFRYPIVKFGKEAKEVIKSDYIEEDFENGITRSMVYRHDDLISNKYTETNVELMEITRDEKTISDHESLSTEFKETGESTDATKFKDKALVTVKNDIETQKIVTKEVPQQSPNTTTEQAPIDSGISIVITDTDSNVVEVVSDKKSDIKEDKVKSKSSRIIIKKNKARRHTLETKDVDIEKAKQARIVKQQTVAVTKTEKRSFNITRKKQPLLVSTSSKSRQTKVKSRDGKMDLTSEESVTERVKIVNTDTGEEVTMEEKMEIATKEIDIDEKIEKQEDRLDNTETAVTEIIEEYTKSMEIRKSYGQEEFGFHLYGRKNYDGHFISKVEQGSGAHKAGLKVGDRVMEIEGRSADEMKHNEIVELIKNATGSLNILVRHEIERLKKAKDNVVQEPEEVDSVKGTSLDFSTMDSARPQRKQPPSSQNWKDKKRMFKNL